MKDAFANVGSAVDHDVPFAGQVVEAAVDTIDPEGETIAAEIGVAGHVEAEAALVGLRRIGEGVGELDRKSTRLNSSHVD